MDIEARMQQALEDFDKRTAPKPAVPCAVILPYRSGPALGALKRVLGDRFPMVTINHFACALIEDQDKAEHLAGAIRSCVEAIKLDDEGARFSANWLEELEEREQRIGSVRVEHNIAKVTQLQQKLDDIRKAQRDSANYDAAETAALAAAENYRGKDFVRDWALFAEGHWQGLDTLAEWEALFTRLWSLMTEANPGGHFCAREPGCRTLSRVVAKAFEMGDRGAFNAERDANKAWCSKRARRQWELASDGVALLLERHCPSLRMRDQDGEAVASLTLGDLLDLSPYSYECDLERRLSPQEIARLEADQGYTVREQMAGTIAAHFLTLMSAKESQAFKRNLREYARRMDQQPLSEALPQIVAGARPGPEFLVPDAA